MLNKIIVVEDNSAHMETAHRLIGEDRIVSVCGVRPVTFSDALQLIRWMARDGLLPGLGVLTDLYFPADEDTHGETAPLGLLVMAECQKLGIPCVIVTAGYHHGQKYHQIHTALRLMGVRLVDSSNSEAEAEEKNWKAGLDQLEELSSTGVG